MIQCLSCGENNPDEYKHCGKCGATLVLYPVSQTDASDASHFSGENYGTKEQGAPPSSHRMRMILSGIIAVGVVIVCCSIGLIGGTIVGSWYPAPAAPAAANPLPTRTLYALAVTGAVPTATASPGEVITSTTTSQTAFQKWSASQVVAAFRAARLEASNPRPMTQEDYAQVPQVATEAIRFFMPSLGGTKGGHVFSFADDADLQTVRAYYQNGNSAAKPPWIFVRDNILVQINGELSSAQAQRYQSALKAMK